MKTKRQVLTLKKHVTNRAVKSTHFFVVVCFDLNCMHTYMYMYISLKALDKGPILKAKTLFDK